MQSLYLYYCAVITLLLMVGCVATKRIGIKSEFSSVFTQQETKLVMRADSLQPMRVLKITNKSDSIVLRTKCIDVKVNPHDPALNHFVSRLYRTVRDSLSMGVGIAAPQVGILRNIIWVQRFDKEGFPFEVYLNPQIIQYSKKTQECPEGCLSIPNRRDTLKTRSYAIWLEYDKIDGSHHEEMIEDFTAVIFQHEIDHLQGILYIDHLEDEVKDTR